MSITTVRERVVGFSHRLTVDERQLAGRWGLREYVEPKVNFFFSKCYRCRLRRSGNARVRDTQWALLWKNFHDHDHDANWRTSERQRVSNLVV